MSGQGEVLAKLLQQVADEMRKVNVNPFSEMEFHEVVPETRDAEFRRQYQLALEQAKTVVADRDEAGRNAVVDLVDMFHDADDAVFVIYMKACRVRGELAVGNYKVAARELTDIINYAGFGLAKLVVDGDIEGLDDATDSDSADS